MADGESNVPAGKDTARSSAVALLVVWTALLLWGCSGCGDDGDGAGIDAGSDTGNDADTGSRVPHGM